VPCRIGDEEAARAAQGRLGMAQQTLVAVVPSAQAIELYGIGKDRIELAESGDRRAIGHVGTGVAGRLQLACSFDTLVERRQLVGRDGGAGCRVRADDRRCGLDAPILKVARCSAYHRGRRNLSAPEPMPQHGQQRGGPDCQSAKVFHVHRPFPR